MVAAYTKNGETATRTLPTDVAVDLAEWIKGIPPGCPVFPLPNRGADMLKVDLKAAGLPYRDASGLVFDFHSLRKCLGSYLRQAKVDPAVSKLYLRHGDIRLTMECYNDERLHDLHAEATSKLPKFTI